METLSTSQVDSVSLTHSEVTIKDLSGSYVDNMYTAGVVYGGMGNTIINELESSGLANIMEYSQKVMKSINMETYVSTYAERALVTNVARSGCVLVKGKSGTGKTTIGLRALAQIRENTKRIPVVLLSPQQWDKLSLGSDESNRRRYVVMIDNIFGSTNFVQSHFDNWEKLFEIMWPLVESGQLLLILTSRPEVISQCEHRVSKYSMFKWAEVLDLHDKYALTAGEMKRLVKRYCGDRCNFSLSDLGEILDPKVSYAIGLPLCCKFFAENEFVQKKGVTFFKNPLDGIVSELGRLRESDQLGFFALLLVLFKDSCLELKLLVPDISEQFKSLLEEIRQFCNLEKVPTVKELKQKMKQLCEVYLFQSNIGFHFQHQSVFDAVVLSISCDFLDRFIQVCPLGVLLEFVRLQTNQQETKERVIYVPDDHYPSLAKRMTALLISQTTSEILRHESLSDQAFAQSIFDCWSENDMADILSLKLEKRSVVVDTFDIEKVDRYRPFSNMNIMFKLTPLLKYTNLLSHLIMTKSPIVQQLILQMRKEKTQLSVAVRSEAIDCAIYTGSIDAVTELQEQGEPLTITNLHNVVMSPLREKDFIERTFDQSEIMSKSTTELGALISTSVQSANENAVILLVEKLKSIQKSQEIFSKCLIQLLLQSSGEMKRKSLYIPSSSRRWNVTNIMRKLFDAGGKPDRYKLLCLASAHDDHSALTFLLKKFPYPKLSSHKSMHFHLACQYGSAACVKTLISKGTDIRTVGVSGNVSSKALDGRVEESEEHEEEYRDYEPDEEEEESSPAEFEREASTGPLHFAANSNRDSFEKVKIILFVLSRRGLSLSLQRQLPDHLPSDVSAEYEFEDKIVPLVEYVNNVDTHSCTPLHYAAARGDAKTVEVLIKAGADLSLVDHWGMSALMCAVLGQSIECVRHLLNYTSFSSGHGTRDILTHIVESLIGSPRTLTHPAALKHYKLASAKLYPMLTQLFELFHERTHDVDFVDSKGTTVLMKSVQSGNMETVKYFLSQKININRRDTTGKTVLHIASKEQDFALVKMLCESGADVNVRDESGRTVLYEAAGSEVDAMDKLEYLLKVKHASLDADSEGRTALFPAVETADMEVVEYLAHNGLCVETCDLHGSSLLHVACKIGDSNKIEMLKPILDMNVNGVSMDENGQTALHIACHKGILKWVQLLLNKNFPLLAQDSKGRSILHLSAASGNVDLVKLIVEKEQHYPVQDKDGQTPLHTAAERNNASVVTLLLEQKPELNLKDFERRTPLLYAIQKHSVVVAEIFISKGLNVCDKDRHGNSPLHTAVNVNSRQTVKLLLTSNVNKSAQNNLGQTAMHIAVRKNFPNLVADLLQSDIDLNIQDSEGKSALHVAVICKHASVVKMLLDRCVTIDLKDSSGKTAMHYSCSLSGAEMFKLLESKGADIRAVDNDDRTALHEAATSNNYDIATYLLDSGTLTADVDKEGNTPLHLAAENGSLNTLRLILERGGDISKQNKQGRTPLHMAAKGHHTECVNLLKEKGADPTLQDNSGMTPFELGEYCKSEASSNVTSRNLFDSDNDLNRTIDEDEEGDEGCYNDSCYENAEFGGFGESQEGTDLDSIVTLQPSRRDIMMTDKKMHVKTPLMQAVEQGEYDLVKALLVSGADPSEQGRHGRTPLHVAVKRGDLEMAELLLIHHADINLEDHDGVTALDLASELNRKEIEELIFVNLCIGDQQQENPVTSVKDQVLNVPPTPPPAAEGPHVTCTITGDNNDVKQEIPIVEFPSSPSQLHQAKVSGNSLLFFAKRGNADDIRKQMRDNADILARDEFGQTVLHFAAMRGESDILQVLLLKNAISSSVQDHRGLTPAHTAAKHGRFGHMKMLIDNASDTNIQDKTGFTPLHYAARLGDFDMVALLLQSNSNPNIRNKHGRTALHFSAEVGDERSVECLLTAGCDVLIQDNDQKTAHSLAEENGHIQCASVLNQYFLKSVKPKE